MLCPLAKHISLALVQPRKTSPYITERLLMGHKESNQTNKNKRPRSKRQKIGYRLIQVKSIAECSNGSILQCFRPSFSYHLSFRSLFCLFLSCRFTQVLLYYTIILKDVFVCVDALCPSQQFFWSCWEDFLSS